MAEMVEHQATVDTGLKMKIKRKNPSSSAGKSCDAKQRKTTEQDKNGNAKNRKSKPDSNHSSAVPFSSTSFDEKTSESVAELSDDQTPKRRRNVTTAVTSRQTRMLKTGDFAKDAKSNRSELFESRKANDSFSNASKEKSRNGKAVSQAKPTTTEKLTRKRCLAQNNNLSLSCSSSASSESNKSKNTKVITIASEREPVDDKMVELLRRPGHGIRVETDGLLQRKSDLIHPDDTGLEPPSSASLSDPYEFIAKVEDTIETPVKKFKSDKVDGADQPIGTGTDHHHHHHQEASTGTCTVGVTTDPDILGPCEPGTSVILEGIVWSESNNGILVVNVTWRGKTYVGTLMDSTKHNWASPRFGDDSSIPELDWRLPKTKRPCGGTPVMAEVLEGRRLRKCRRPANGCASSKPPSRQSPVYNDANLGRRRGAKTFEHVESNCVASQAVLLDSCCRRPAEEGAPLDGGEQTLLECIGFDCRKKFRDASGLSYHRSHAHGKSTLGRSGSGVTEEMPVPLTADDNPEICPAVSENNEDSNAGEDRRFQLGSVGDSSSVAADIVLETTAVEFPAVITEQTIMASATVSTLRSDNNASVESVGNSVSNLSQLAVAGDGVEDSKHIAGGAESCPGKSAVCCKVSADDDDDDKEDKDTMYPVSPRSSEPEKVDLVVEVNANPSASCGVPLTHHHHFSKSSDHRTLPQTSTTARDGDSNAVNRVFASLSESFAVEVPRNSTTEGSEGNSDEKSSAAYSDISENNDEVVDSKPARLHGKEAILGAHTNQNETTRHRPTTNPETPGSLYSPAANLPSAPSRNHSHDTSIRLQNNTMTTVEPDTSQKTEHTSFAGLQQPEEEKAGNRAVNADINSHPEEEGTAQEFADRRHPTTAVGTKVTPVIVTSSVPYSYGQDYSAYHTQFFAQNPESRNQYERWLMEHGHRYIHQQQQQRCFNNPMLAEADACPTSQAEPVDMSSKGHANTDRHSFSSSGTRLSEQSMTMTKSADNNNKTPGKSTGKDWFPAAPTTHHRNLPVANVISDWTSPGYSSSCPSAGITTSLREGSRPKDSTKLPCVNNLDQGQRSLDHDVPSRPPPNPIAATAPYSSDCKPGYAKSFAHGPPPPPPRLASLVGAYGGAGVSYVDWPDCNSPNTKLLDLDSKEVVSGCDRRRSSGPGGGETARRALDLLRCRDASSQPGKDAPEWAQREGSADHSSSLTLCHLHTHHHTHLVGAAYPIYGSYNGLMSSVPAMVSPVPPTYLPK